MLSMLPHSQSGCADVVVERSPYGSGPLGNLIGLWDFSDHECCLLSAESDVAWPEDALSGLDGTWRSIHEVLERGGYEIAYLV
jgi:hypothetical protein